jgi:hypothetical protein
MDIFNANILLQKLTKYPGFIYTYYKFKYKVII